MRQWWPRPEEINCKAKQFGAGVQGGVDQVAVRARVHHETKNWLILTGCSYAFNTVKRTAVLAEGSPLRAGTHPVRRQMLRREIFTRVLPDGLGRQVERSYPCLHDKRRTTA